VPSRGRRLQRDAILDTADARLLAAGTALRVRADGDRAFLTFKGPVMPGTMKAREEIETEAASADALLAICAALGFAPAFRYEKYREEFALPGVVIAVDDTPIGAFVEIEGDEGAIAALADRLGFSTADYVTASYRALFLASAGAGGGARDMTFPSVPSRSP
jgi:adenylate cyclase, class 2